jgi:hypothetical protein
MRIKNIYMYTSLPHSATVSKGHKTIENYSFYSGGGEGNFIRI